MLTLFVLAIVILVLGAFGMIIKVTYDILSHIASTLFSSGHDSATVSKGKRGTKRKK